jgi:hypothetical protein
MRLFVVVLVLGALVYFEYRTGWIVKAMQKQNASDKGSTS